MECWDPGAGTLSADDGTDEANTSLVEAVVLAGTLSMGLEVQCEEQLSSGGVQVNWQSDSCH